MKLMKKTAAVLIAVLIVFSSLNCAVLAESGWDGVAETPCTEGNGDPNNPYEISTPEQLAWFRNTINAGSDKNLCAKLTADIDLNNKNWTPIGGGNYAPSTTDLNKAFCGNFDGNGHTISGLNISIESLNNDNRRYIGLFGHVQGTSGAYLEIKNLTVKGSITITSSTNSTPSFIGGICGCGAYLTVSNCISEVNISVNSSKKTGTYVGGIVGNVFATMSITDCGNNGSISGNITKAGGIFGGNGGFAYNTIITRCYNSGNVSGNKALGGLGFDMTGTLTDCYNTGNVTATREDNALDGSGGLIGRNYGSDNLTVNNCFTTGIVSSEYTNYTGGVYGTSSGSNTTVIKFENVYYLEGICSRTQGTYGQYSGGDYELIQLTAEDMASDDFVAQLNLNAGSTIFKKGSSHPIFIWQKDESAPVGTKGDIDGNGTVNATDVSELISRIANDNVPDNAVADMNGDGTVNATDVSELISVIAGE